MYSFGPKRLVLALMVVALVGMVVVGGLNYESNLLRPEVSSGQQGSVVWAGNESNSGSPIRIRLGMTEAPPLGKSAGLLVEVTSAMDAADVEVHIRLPEGLVMTSGSPDWKGSILRDQKVDLRYTVKSVRVGNWVIEASAKWSFAEGSFYENSDRIYISVSENTASFLTASISDTHTTDLPSGNETQPPPPLPPENMTISFPTEVIGELVIFVSPTIVALGEETTVTILYSAKPAPIDNITLPSMIVRGGTPSFSGPVIVTYGPVRDNQGQWVAKIKPTSLGVIEVIGQDESGNVHVKTQITVVQSLPPPVGQQWQAVEVSVYPQEN
jgi:hypothetical protein